MKISRLMATKSDCEILPPFYYGYSYRDFYANIVYYHIIPINYVIRAYRFLFWLWNIFRSKPSYVDRFILRESIRRSDLRLAIHYFKEERENEKTKHLF